MEQLQEQYISFKKEFIMNVRVASEKDKDDWNTFVAKHSDYPCFLYQWKEMLERVYGYECTFLIAKDQNEIAGVFPISIMRSKVFGQRLCSLPFSDYGGPLFSPEKTGISLDLFTDYLIPHLNKADFLEVRTPMQASVSNCLRNSLELGNAKYVTFVIDLQKPFDEVWRNQFDKYLRNSIRKAIKNGIKVSEENFEEKFSEFYTLYLMTMKKLGSPPHGEKFFRTCYALLGESHVKLFLASMLGRTIGGVLTFLGKHIIYPVYEGINPKYRSLNTASMLFSSMMEWGCNEGYRNFDFGRTLLGSGVYLFKKQWGGIEKALPYYYSGKKIPHQDPREKYDHISKIWSKVTPLSVTRIVGPFFKGGIGY